MSESQFMSHELEPLGPEEDQRPQPQSFTLSKSMLELPKLQAPRFPYLSNEDRVVCPIVIVKVKCGDT